MQHETILLLVTPFLPDVLLSRLLLMLYAPLGRPHRWNTSTSVHSSKYQSSFIPVWLSVCRLDWARAIFAFEFSSTSHPFTIRFSPGKTCTHIRTTWVLSLECWMEFCLFEGNTWTTNVAIQQFHSIFLARLDERNVVLLQYPRASVRIIWDAGKWAKFC